VNLTGGPRHFYLHFEADELEALADEIEKATSVTDGLFFLEYMLGKLKEAPQPPVQTQEEA